MKKQPRPETWRRPRAIRKDATVGSTARIIEENFSLPEGCVQLCLPTGKKARRDKKIEALLRDWNW